MKGVDDAITGVYMHTKKEEETKKKSIPVDSDVRGKELTFL